MGFSLASVVPRRVTTPVQARAEVAARGAAIVGGLTGREAAFAAGRAFLGADLRRFGLQFEATKAQREAAAAAIADQPADARGRERRFNGTTERMVAHNDGFGFGDFGPDYLFLWCARPDAAGQGASFLVDGLDAAGADGGDRVRGRRAVSRGALASTSPSRTSPSPPMPRSRGGCRRAGSRSGTTRSRHGPGPGTRHDGGRGGLIGKWSKAVTAARDAGPMFRARAGDLICVDNYRLTHGRDGYSDPSRVMLSIWGWSAQAVACRRARWTSSGR